MTIPVNIWHETLLEDGSCRIVALSLDGKTLHVALRSAAGADAKSEVSFELGHAFDLAKACLEGNARALTTPGLTRVLCAAVLVLGKAAFKAGGLQVMPGHDEHFDHSRNRDEAQGDGADTD
ncbi:MAG: hypothetical protein ACRCU5_13965 [Rhizobiaceae bacterium]